VAVAAGLDAMRAATVGPAALPRIPGWRDWALFVWLAGAGLALVRVASGSVLAARAVRGAQPAGDTGWNALLDEAARTIGVRRPVELRVSGAVDIAQIWDYRSAVVLLPATSAGWSEERRRAILLHELSHVARHDCLNQTLAYVVRAVYWPQPLVWWAVSRLRREAEYACDDRVLGAGMAAEEYARHLVEAARGRRRSASLLTAAAGAEGTRLGDRVRALLDDRRDRRAPTLGAGVRSGVIALVALGLLAAAEPAVPGKAGPADSRLSTGIAHEAVGCLIQGTYPEIDATVDPGFDVGEVRLYFGSARWAEGVEYWTAMSRIDGRFVGRLPRPRAAASPVHYRIEARAKDGRVASTPRHAAVVAESQSGCPEGARIAPAASTSDAVIVHGPDKSGAAHQQ
jgi:beta-lactamase regulating signal transducer with metallopeptidase domain